jgi:DNA-binding response OmpR family regulator
MSLLGRRRAMDHIVAKPNEHEGVVQLGELVIDRSRFEARIGKQEIRFTRTELYILWTLASKRGKTFTREELIQAVWGSSVHVNPRTIDAHIVRLRTKLRRHRHIPAIQTIWRVGYRVRPATR